MRAQAYLCTLLAASLLTLGGCLLPGSKSSKPEANAGFFGDYALLREAKPVHRAYVEPGTDLGQFRSVRILDFTNFTGHEVDPETLALVAETLTRELELLPPSQRPFEIIDRSPRTASAWVDLVLEGALTVYNVRTEGSSWTRMNDQVVIGIECKLIEHKTGKVVAMIQHRTKENIAEVQYENPVREALQRIGRDVAQFLARPEVGRGGGAGDDEKDGEDARRSRL